MADSLKEQTGKMPKSRQKKLAIVIWSLIVFLGFAGWLSSRDDQSSQNAPVAQTTPVDLTNARELDEKYSAEATVRCSSGADDYLRSVAKYDFKWDEMGFLETKFDQYLKQVAAPGVLVVISDKAKLQNGFGAYKHVELLCSYDTQSQKVLSYSIRGNND